MAIDPDFAAAIDASARLPVTMASALQADARILFVLPAYPADPATVARDAPLHTRATLGVIDTLTRRRLAGHRGLYRDHYANPRPLPYLLGLVRAVTGAASLASAPDMIVDRAFPAADQASGEVQVIDLRQAGQQALQQAASSGRHDAIVLVWPDALGLGWESLERALPDSARVFALNGRRRFFALDAATRRALAPRRFLAHTRLAELLFGLAVFPIAGACAAVDAVRRR